MAALLCRHPKSVAALHRHLLAAAKLAPRSTRTSLCAIAAGGGSREYRGYAESASDSPRSRRSPRSEQWAQGAPARAPDEAARDTDRDDRPWDGERGRDRGDRPWGGERGRDRGDRPWGGERGRDRGDRPWGGETGRDRGDRPASGPRRAPRSSSSHERAASSVPGVALYATCHPGLEQVVAAELTQLGYEGVEPLKAGVAFRAARLSDAYRAVLWLRSAVRVLALLAEGPLDTDPQGGQRGGNALYDFVYDAAPWHEIIPTGCTFSVEPRLWSCTDLTSSRVVWARVKDAICDRIRETRPEKIYPPDRGEMADVPLYVTAYQDRVKLYRDLCGNSLHRRGYRDAMHRAALNEAAAAGVLHLAGWPEMLRQAGDGEGLVLADPMCGSGTVLIEAALMARGIAPGLMRSLSRDAAGSSGGSRRAMAMSPDAWPFQLWDDYDAGAWANAVEEARERVRPWRGKLIGVEVHESAHGLAVRQARMAGVANMLDLTWADCGVVVPELTPQLVVTNPPWGMRLGGEEDDGHEGYDYEGDEEDVEDRRRGGEGGWSEAGGYQRRGNGREGAGGEGQQDGAEAPALERAWKSLDGFLYRHCPGAAAFVVCGNPTAFRHLKLKPSIKHRLTLSGVDVQVAGYKIRDAASRQQAAEWAAGQASAKEAGPQHEDGTAGAHREAPPPAHSRPVAPRLTPMPAAAPQPAAAVAAAAGGGAGARSSAAGSSLRAAAATRDRAPRTSDGARGAQGGASRVTTGASGPASAPGAAGAAAAVGAASFRDNTGDADEDYWEQ